MGFPGGLDGKESACNEGDPGSIYICSLDIDKSKYRWAIKILIDMIVDI